MRTFKATWSQSLPAFNVVGGLKTAAVGAMALTTAACSSVPNDGALFQSTGRVLKEARVVHVLYSSTLVEIGREDGGTVPLMMNANSEPPVLGRCFYKVVVGFNEGGTDLVEELIERRCPNNVKGITPLAPFNRY